MWLVALLLACAAGRVAPQPPSYYVKTLELTPAILSDTSLYSWTNAVSDGVQYYYKYASRSGGSNGAQNDFLVAVSASTGQATVLADQTVLYNAFSMAADSSGNVYVLDRYNNKMNTTCFTDMMCSSSCNYVGCCQCARLCKFAVTAPGVCVSLPGYNPDGYEKALSVDVAGNLYVYSVKYNMTAPDPKVVRIKNGVASTLTLTPSPWDVLFPANNNGGVFRGNWGPYSSLTVGFRFDASGNLYTVPYDYSVQGNNFIQSVNRVCK